MVRVVVTLLAGWGLGWLVARSKVAEPVREGLVALKGRLDANLAAWRASAESYMAAPLADRDRMARPAILPAAWFAWPLAAFLAGVTHCAACSGFWIGCALGAFRPADGAGIGGALLTGVCVMGANAALDAFTGRHSAAESLAWKQIDGLDAMKNSINLGLAFAIGKGGAPIMPAPKSEAN